MPPVVPRDPGQFARVLTALEQLSDTLTPSPIAEVSIVDEAGVDFRSWHTNAADPALTGRLDSWARAHVAVVVQPRMVNPGLRRRDQIGGAGGDPDRTITGEDLDHDPSPAAPPPTSAPTPPTNAPRLRRGPRAATVRPASAPTGRSACCCRHRSATESGSPDCSKPASCTDQIRADLHLAIAEAAMVAALMSHDMGEHHDARVHWLLALDEARQADVESSSDLMVDVLLDMAHQSLHLCDTLEALKLTDLAHIVVASPRGLVSVCTQSYLDINRAWCHASQGKADPTRRALDIAHQRYADADPATATPWARHVGRAEIAAQHGHAMFLLAEAVGDTNRAAAEAIGRLRSAVDGYGGDYARSAAVNLPGLASCLVRVGDIPAAVTTGHQAGHGHHRPVLPAAARLPAPAGRHRAAALAPPGRRGPGPAHHRGDGRVSATGSDGKLPGPDEIRALCAEYGVDSADAKLLHARSNAAYLLPHDDLVIPVARRPSCAGNERAPRSW